MARFIIRIELHDANDTDYDTLHKAARERGMKRRVKGPDGRQYRLPTGVYSRRSDEPLEDVQAEAVEAAKVTGCTYSIITVEARSLTCSGLKPVI